MQPNPSEPLYTYQDLVAHFQVAYKTIYRWFRWRRRFKPTNNTIRITETEVKNFVTEYNLKDENKRKLNWP